MARLALPLSGTDHEMLREIRDGLAAQIGRTSLITAVRYALRCAVLQMRGQGLIGDPMPAPPADPPPGAPGR